MNRIDDWIERMYYKLRLNFLRSKHVVESEKESVERKIQMIWNTSPKAIEAGAPSYEELEQKDIRTATQLIDLKQRLVEELNEIMLYEEKLRIASRLPDVVVPPSVDDA